jgi:hypothetical protein
VRAKKSTVPPAGKGTNTLMGLFGKACAKTKPGQHKTNTAMRRNQKERMAFP